MPTPRRLIVLCFACVLTVTASVSAQVLARPNWAGSGINTDLWWKHAVIYQVNPANFSANEGSPLHGVTQRLDYIHSLGADAILLTSLQPDAIPAQSPDQNIALNTAPSTAQSIDAALGTLDDLDDIIHEASSRHIRVLLDLNPGIPAADLVSVAHFWLNHGIAGFHVPGTSDAAHLQAAGLRAAATTYLGQRILITDAEPNSAAVAVSQPEAQPQHTTRGRHHAHTRSQSPGRPLTALDSESPQLLLDSNIAAIPTLTASSFRPAIDQIQNILLSSHSLPLLATDGPAFTRSMGRYADGRHDVAIAKMLATLLFTTRAESLVYYGQELGVAAGPEPGKLISWSAPPQPAKGQAATQPTPGDSVRSVALEDADPDSLLNWYRQLSALHHGNATLNAGSSITINRDQQNVIVLIRKPQTVSSQSPVVVILLNLSAQPVTISLKEDTAKLGLRGSFLRTILRSDAGMGTLHLASMKLAPYAAYIGELRY